MTIDHNNCINCRQFMLVHVPIRYAGVYTCIDTYNLYTDEMHLTFKNIYPAFTVTEHHTITLKKAEEIKC